MWISECDFLTHDRQAVRRDCHDADLSLTSVYLVLCSGGVADENCGLSHLQRQTCKQSQRKGRAAIGGGRRPQHTNQGAIRSFSSAEGAFSAVGWKYVYLAVPYRAPPPFDTR